MSKPTFSQNAAPGVSPEIDPGGRAAPGRAAGKRVLLLVNRRGGHSDWSEEEVTGWLVRQDLAVDPFFTDDPSEIPHMLRRRGGEANIVAIAGGDGTISNCAGALMELGLPLLLLPFGTANDLARTLGIPLDPEAAAGLATAGCLHRIDVGMVGGKPFFNVANVGLGVEVAQFHTGAIKRWFKVAGYVASWIAAYRRHRPFRATIRCDDRIVEARCTQLAVANGRHHGGGLTVSEDALIDDGLFHVYFIEAVGALKLLAMFFALKRGSLRHERNAEVLSCRRVELDTRPPREISADGEPAGRTPASFTMRREAVEIFVPAE